MKILWGAVFSVLGMLAMGYAILLHRTVGLGKNFTLFWPGLGCACLVTALILGLEAMGICHVPEEIWHPLAVGAGTLLALILYLEGRIVWAGSRSPERDADYCIVLGCKVNGNRPSTALRYRIEAAARYLTDHPQTLAIASGGQGADEGISEASCIRQELIAAGIAEERILMEDHSTSTMENIHYSRELIADSEARVVMITSNYHVYRSMELAKRAGLRRVSGFGAEPGPVMALHYFVREAFALVKDYLVGNL